MTAAQVMLTLAGAMLAVAACFSLFRLAKGPSSLDRGVASDVILVIVAVAVALHAAWTRTDFGLVISVVLALLGFTSAVGLARLITATKAGERDFTEPDVGEGGSDG